MSDGPEPLLPPEWLAATTGKPDGGDATAAFSELYERYYDRLVRLCDWQLGDRHLAEDAAQETLLRAMRYFGGYDPDRPLWPWLRAIALRIAHRDRKRTAAEWATDLADADDLFAPAAREADDVDQWVVLRAALAAVPGRQRAALMVRYISDFSTADAARLFELDVNAFEQLLWRARRRLAVEYKRVAVEERRRR